MSSFSFVDGVISAIQACFRPIGPFSLFVAFCFLFLLGKYASLFLLLALYVPHAILDLICSSSSAKLAGLINIKIYKIIDLSCQKKGKLAKTVD